MGLLWSQVIYCRVHKSPPEEGSEPAEFISATLRHR